HDPRPRQRLAGVLRADVRAAAAADVAQGGRALPRGAGARRGRSPLWAPGRPPRRTLLKALERFGEGDGRAAVDLGCGDGRDAIELLRQGWRVLAIDAEPAAMERLKARADLPAGAALETRCARFEEAAWPVVG